jgi:hypothetical protein
MDFILLILGNPVILSKEVWLSLANKPRHHAPAFVECQR